MPLVRRAEPFDHPDWIFEVKYDRFRALAHVESGAVRLVSRNGNPYRQFGQLCHDLAAELRCGESAVLDGELACLDDDGRPRFDHLFQRQGTPVFVAFDLVALDGRDLRDIPLLERKRRLRAWCRENRAAPSTSTTSQGAGVSLYRWCDGTFGQLQAQPKALCADSYSTALKV
ncbi:MAG TPA: hypothetical protein VFC51_12155 [Chloroflexota bacterium]|nr:hypothetical protein [Chloroflexota bacterium]